MEYKLVGSTKVNLDDLEKRVNDLIKEGWRPLGSPVTLTANGMNQNIHYHTIVQAMTRDINQTT